MRRDPADSHLKVLLLGNNDLLTAKNFGFPIMQAQIELLEKRLPLLQLAFVMLELPASLF